MGVRRLRSPSGQSMSFSFPDMRYRNRLWQIKPNDSAMSSRVLVLYGEVMYDQKQTCRNTNLVSVKAESPRSRITKGKPILDTR